MDLIGGEAIALDKDVEINEFGSFLIHAGMYPFSFEKVLKYLKEENKKIVYDVDDAITLIDESNPSYYAIKKDSGSFTELLEHADEVTTTTQIMADYLKPLTKANITVIPNCYDPKEWTYPRPKREGLRIGFAGSGTHVADLLLVLPSIRKLQKKYHFKFILFGLGPQATYQEWFKAYRYVSTEKGIAELYEFDKILSEITFEWCPYVDYENYPATLTNIALDIGLCPLKDTPFNRCRSAVKAMEYTLSGALALASDLPPYQAEQSSILVKDDAWEDCLEALLKHPETIKDFRAASETWIKENRNISTQLDTLKKVYGV